MKRYPRNVYVTALASLLTDISTEMVIYLVPLFLANVLSTPTAIIGLIEGVAETTRPASQNWFRGGSPTASAIGNGPLWWAIRFR